MHESSVEKSKISISSFFNRKHLLAAVLIISPLLAFFYSLTIGRYDYIPFRTVVDVVLSRFFDIEPYWDPVYEIVVFRLRIPRALLAMLIGAGLAVSGASFQGIFRNPLVSPHILGVATGSAFGGLLAMMLFRNQALDLLFAIIFGFVALILAHLMSRVRGGTPILMLVLAGVVVNAFFSAMISLVSYTADPIAELPDVVFTLMGSLADASYQKLDIVTVPILVCILVLYLLRWRINLLSLGDEDAQALGVRVERIKWLIITCVTVIVALCVSVSGVIGWVGLALPHIARMLVGPDHRVLIPTSISLGAVYLLLMDDIARTLTPAEIPLGILTAIIGAVIFGYLLKRTQGRGWVDS